MKTEIKIPSMGESVTEVTVSVILRSSGSAVATDDEILEILKNYELLELFNGLKNGIYSDAGVQGNELSHGMQKIVILLRTILKVMDALIIIFDEPLAGLDENTRKKVIKLINDYCKNKTLIIITKRNII
mgnify:CR=1 FL=1